MKHHPVWERFRPHRVVGARSLNFSIVVSTMDVAWERAEEGAAHGTIVLADHQEQGRGRLSRQWFSMPGGSVLLSAILRMPPLQPSPLITIAGALAVADCVRNFVDAPVDIKWPNDVMIQGRKVAGVLAESRIDPERMGVVVLGIGVNVSGATVRTDAIATIATSIEDMAGHHVEITDVEESLIANLDYWQKRLAVDEEGVLGTFRQSINTFGERVSIMTRGGLVEGVASSVDRLGRLVVTDDDGRENYLHEGDVSIRG